MNWQRNVEVFWTVFINSSILMWAIEIKEEHSKNFLGLKVVHVKGFRLLGVMIFIYSTREFHPVPEPIVDFTPKETFFLKCDIHVDRGFLKGWSNRKIFPEFNNSQGIWDTSQQMPPTTHEDYRETLSLEQDTLQQLITNYTCDYWPEHKVMT